MTGFHDIIGQEPVVAVLRNAARTGKTPHAIIFDGEKGMGKKTLAQAFAAALLCQSPTEAGEPCGRCHSCIMVENESHPDLVTVTHEDKESIGVDEIRVVVNDVVIKPYHGGRKIYIIPDAHRMTHQAQNALLKTLEEPPGYVVILLLADNKDLLLPTLLSRSVCLSLRPVEKGNLLRILSGKIGDDPVQNDIGAVASYARGNPGKAIQLSKSEEFGEFWDSSLKLLKNARTMSDVSFSALADEIVKKKGRQKEYLTLFLLWFRDVLFLKAGGTEEKLIFSEEIPAIEEAAGYYSFERLNDITEAIKEAGSLLDSNVQAESVFEMLFMKMR